MFSSIGILQWKKIEKDLDDFWHFLWVCWFLGKNVSNFASPVWKLHNPYCQTIGSLFVIWTSPRQKSYDLIFGVYWYSDSCEYYFFLFCFACSYLFIFIFSFRSASYTRLRVTTDEPYLTNFMYDNNAVEPDFETEAENVTSNNSTKGKFTLWVLNIVAQKNCSSF